MHAAGRREGRPTTAADFVAARRARAVTDTAAVASGTDPVAVSCYATIAIPNAVTIPPTVPAGDTTRGPGAAAASSAAPTTGSAPAATTFRQCGPCRQRGDCDCDHEDSKCLHVHASLILS
jgi:hypothetical protein